MASGVNTQIVVGNLAADAELVHVGARNTAKCSFRVIANTGFGDYQHAEGFNVVLWGKRAAGLAAHLTTGTRVYVAGETRTRNWANEDGQRHYRTEVIADEIVLLGGGFAATADDDRAVGEDDEDPVPF